MKNEDRIVELLAESLRKQDQHSELLTKLVDGQEKLVDVQEKLVDGQLQTNQRLGKLEDKFDRLLHFITDGLMQRLDSLEDRIQKVEQKQNS